MPNYLILILRTKTFTPSMYLTYKDPFLTFTLVMELLKAYVEHIDDCEWDAYISPIYMDDSVISSLL